MAVVTRRPVDPARYHQGVLGAAEELLTSAGEGSAGTAVSA
jgi:hypothetical protein